MRISVISGQAKVISYIIRNIERSLMHYKGRPSNYLFQLFLTLLGRPEENSSYFSNVRSVLTFSYGNHMTFAYGKNRLAVLPTYRRMCEFIILIHFLALTVLYKNNTFTFSVLMLLRENEHLAHKLYMHRNRKKTYSRKIITSKR